MKDLEDVQAEWLAHSVPRTANSSPLIEYIRNGGRITPQLSQLIANILDGSVKAKPKAKRGAEPRSSVGRLLIQANIDCWKELLKNPPDELYDYVEKMLRAVGITAFPERPTDQTKAAMTIVAHLAGLTDAQLEELRFPRKARPRKL